MIWQRYIRRETLKVFFLFLLSFYFLYVLVDYSSHMQDFMQDKKIAFGRVSRYYLYQFIKRADILLPLALLLSTIKVLCGLNSKRELVAFQSAGISWKRLVRPILSIALVCTATIVVINQYALPRALCEIDRFYDSHLRSSHRGQRLEPIHVVYLPDQSKLIYQSYNSAKEAYFDVMWMRSASDIWRMKYLNADPKRAIGHFVDHLEQNQQGFLEKTASFDAYLFTDLKWDKDLPRKGFIPYENYSMSALVKMLTSDSLASKSASDEIQTQLFFKATMPLLAPLCLIAVAPFCITYRRQMHAFLIFACALFSFVAFIALMDAAVILGETHTLSPKLAILVPFMCGFAIFGWNYSRAR